MNTDAILSRCVAACAQVPGVRGGGGAGQPLQLVQWPPPHGRDLREDRPLRPPAGRQARGRPQHHRTLEMTSFTRHFLLDSVFSLAILIPIFCSRTHKHENKNCTCDIQYLSIF
jgi:hypothetical protein